MCACLSALLVCTAGQSVGPFRALRQPWRSQQHPRCCARCQASLARRSHPTRAWNYQLPARLAPIAGGLCWAQRCSWRGHVVVPQQPWADVTSGRCHCCGREAGVPRMPLSVRGPGRTPSGQSCSAYSGAHCPSQRLRVARRRGGACRQRAERPRGRRAGRSDGGGGVDCPAAHRGFAVPSLERCGAGKPITSRSFGHTRLGVSTAATA